MSSRLPIILAGLLLVSCALNAALWGSRMRMQEDMAALRADNAALLAVRTADQSSQVLAQKLTKEACDAAEQSRHAIDAALAADAPDLLPELCRVLRQTADRAAAATGKPDAAVSQPGHARGSDADH